MATRTGTLPDVYVENMADMNGFISPLRKPVPDSYSWQQSLMGRLSQMGGLGRSLQFGEVSEAEIASSAPVKVNLPSPVQGSVSDFYPNIDKLTKTTNIDPAVNKVIPAHTSTYPIGPTIKTSGNVSTDIANFSDNIKFYTPEGILFYPSMAIKLNSSERPILPNQQPEYKIAYSKGDFNLVDPTVDGLYKYILYDLKDYLQKYVPASEKLKLEAKFIRFLAYLSEAAVKSKKETISFNDIYQVKVDRISNKFIVFFNKYSRFTIFEFRINRRGQTFTFRRVVTDKHKPSKKRGIPGINLENYDKGTSEDKLEVSENRKRGLRKGVNTPIPAREGKRGKKVKKVKKDRVSGVEQIYRDCQDCEDTIEQISAVISKSYIFGDRFRDSDDKEAKKMMMRWLAWRSADCAACYKGMTKPGFALHILQKAEKSYKKHEAKILALRKEQQEEHRKIVKRVEVYLSAIMQLDILQDATGVGSRETLLKILFKVKEDKILDNKAKHFLVRRIKGLHKEWQRDAKRLRRKSPGPLSYATALHATPFELLGIETGNDVSRDLSRFIKRSVSAPFSGVSRPLCSCGGVCGCGGNCGNCSTCGIGNIIHTQYINGLNNYEGGLNNMATSGKVYDSGLTQMRTLGTTTATYTSSNTQMQPITGPFGRINGQPIYNQASLFGTRSRLGDLPDTGVQIPSDMATLLTTGEIVWSQDTTRAAQTPTTPGTDLVAPQNGVDAFSFAVANATSQMMLSSFTPSDAFVQSITAAGITPGHNVSSIIPPMSSEATIADHVIANNSTLNAQAPRDPGSALMQSPYYSQPPDVNYATLMGLGTVESDIRNASCSTLRYMRDRYQSAGSGSHSSYVLARNEYNSRCRADVSVDDASSPSRPTCDDTSSCNAKRATRDSFKRQLDALKAQRDTAINAVSTTSYKYNSYSAEQIRNERASIRNSYAARIESLTRLYDDARHSYNYYCVDCISPSGNSASSTRSSRSGRTGRRQQAHTQANSEPVEYSSQAQAEGYSRRQTSEGAATRTDAVQMINAVKPVMSYALANTLRTAYPDAYARYGISNFFSHACDDKAAGLVAAFTNSNGRVRDPSTGQEVTPGGPGWAAAAGRIGNGDWTSAWTYCRYTSIPNAYRAWVQAQDQNAASQNSAPAQGTNSPNYGSAASSAAQSVASAAASRYAAARRGMPRG